MNCNSISVDIVFIWISQEPGPPGALDIENCQCTETATDGDPVFYDISYLVQFLLDIKTKFLPPVNRRLLIK